MVAKRVRQGISIIAFGGAVGCGMEPLPESGVELGEVLYERCVPCHGAAGEGNPDISAPAIAGMEAGYVERQLHNFLQGVRGRHPEDAEGIRMMPMARSLVAYSEGFRDDAGTAINVEAVSEYVALMASTVSEPYMTSGDAANGEILYASAQCMSCHGAQAEGGALAVTAEGINTSGVVYGGEEGETAPALAGLADWYLYAQLGKFDSGIRGANAELDPAGATMAHWARQLNNQPDGFDQARKDLAAYLTTL